MELLWKKRAESFKKLIGNKGGKDDQFGNTTTYLLIALGGNMTNLNCSGKTSLTEEAAETYDALQLLRVDLRSMRGAKQHGRLHRAGHVQGQVRRDQDQKRPPPPRS